MAGPPYRATRIIRNYGSISQLYYGQPGPGANNTPGADVMRVSPVAFDTIVTVDRLVFKVNTAGSAGDVVRVGIYRDNGNVYPGALLLDAGTQAIDTTGVKEVTISQVLTPGWYWLALVRQGNAGTPAFEANDKAQFGVGLNNLGGSPNFNGYQQPSVSGALPSMFTTTPTAEVGLRMWLRIA